MPTPPDLSALDYDAFVALLFDHGVHEGPEIDYDLDDVDGTLRELEARPRAWYWDVDWSWSELPNDPLHTLDLMTTLFERAAELPARFSARQIAEALNLIIGPAGADPFLYPIWNAELPWAPRERLLKAVLPLYERLFDVTLDIEHVPFMFWDMCSASATLIVQWRFPSQRTMGAFKRRPRRSFAI
jgi:hypothetical protein